MKRDILYVDDEPENIIVFEANFENEFNIRTATNGQEALELLDRVPIPVVVSDQRMPGMTGVELFEILRNKHPHTKRVILTGYIDSAAMLDAINKGQVFHFVTKPWERHVLMSVLIRALEAHDLEMSNMALTSQLVASERCATLGQAAARVAHEMGNQLCMLPILELIEDRYRDCEDLVKMADFSRQTHDRLVALIDEVKSFVRFEPDEMPHRPIGLAEAVHELVSFVRFDKSIPQSRFTINVFAEPLVLGNKVKIQQVIVNLVKNAAYAIKDRPDGQITLTLDCDGRDALLTVADNGCGMTAETLARIWDPFFTTKGKDGNGLGLDICRRLIEHHRGQITCESTPGRGTTFAVRLPTVDSGQLKRAEPAELAVVGANI